MRNKKDIKVFENKKEERIIRKNGLSSFSIIIIIISFVLLGWIFIPQLSIKLNPSRKYPVVNVSFNMWGQSARVVETEVTSKLEAMLSRIKGVQEISSYSSNGSGSITVKLSEHVDPDMARFEISTIIRQTWPSLPPGVSYPSIYMSGTTEEANYPFLRYTINAPVSPILIQEYVENNIKTRLSELKGIDRIDVNGASRMVYKLTYDFEQLEIYKISVNEIKSAIQSYLSQEFLGIGKIEDENKQEQWIRVALVAEERNKLFDPSVIQVKNNEGTIVFLKQLVKTSLEEEEASSFFRINGLNSIYLSITAEDAANQLKLSNEIQAFMKTIENSLPSGYAFSLTYDAGEYIKAEMDKIYFRSGLTVLILIGFILLIYRNIKYSFLIIFSLIANISIAALFYYLLKIELQMFSLAGLTISLTFIIDNAIIMSDQIIERGNKKTFMAILTATITTIGALAILFFLEEGVRLNLLDFAWVIIINLVVSLLIALFLVPAVIEKLHITKRQKFQSKEFDRPSSPFLLFLRKMKSRRSVVIFNRIYEKIICFTYRKRHWITVLLVLAFGLPVFLLPGKIEKKTKRGYFTISQDEDIGFWGDLYNNTFGSAFYKETIKPVTDVILGGTMRLFAREVREGSYSSGDRSETSLNIAATLPNGSTREQMNTLMQRRKII